MSKSIDLFIANPAGNITIMVTTPVSGDEYQSIAASLLAIDFSKEYGISFPGSDSPIMGEQVAYIRSLGSVNGDLPEMDMCGLEFCGNASRSFAYYIARQHAHSSKTLSDAVNRLPDGSYSVKVRVSGCEEPLNAVADLDNHTASIQMPRPSDLREITIPSDIIMKGSGGLRASLVNMDGISHLIVPESDPSAELFERIRKYIYCNISPDMPALGVMFMDKTSDMMIPVVYVHDVDTTYFEGSCASGTTAASCALAAGSDDGIFNYTFRQPSGTLYTELVKTDGHIQEISLKGDLVLSDSFTIDI